MEQCPAIIIISHVHARQFTQLATIRDKRFVHTEFDYTFCLVPDSTFCLASLHSGGCPLPLDRFPFVNSLCPH